MAAPVEVPGPLLSDEEREKLHALIEGADSVELKLTVPEEDQRSTVQALGLDPLQAEIRQVFFLDTPELSLDQSGLVVRARRSQKKGDDSVVKLRPVVPSELSRSIRKAAVLLDRGRRIAERLRLLRVDEGCARDGQRPPGGERKATASQAVLEGAAGAVRGICPGWDRARRPLDSRPDLRPQAEVRAGRASGERWSSRCGSIRMGHGSSSSRPSVCRRRPSTWPPRLAVFLRRKV